jgi:cholesterol transport system auxiliary component
VNVPEKQEYKLDNPQTARLTHRPTHQTLLVSKPLAASGYNDTDMRYVIKPYELASFAKNVWVAPPAEMLQTVLLESLQNSGYFFAVVRAPFSGNTTRRLDTQILSLKQNFLKKPSYVDVVIKADLVNEKTNRLIRSKRFEAHLKAPEDSPYGGVLAANKAVNQIMKQIVRFSAL